MARTPQPATRIGVLLGAIVSSILVVAFVLSGEPILIVFAGLPTAVGILIGASIDRSRRQTHRGLIDRDPRRREGRRR